MLWSSFLFKVCFAKYKSRSKICFRRLNTKVRWKVFTKLALKKLYKVWYKLIIYICHICHICETYVWNLKMLYILQNHDTEGRSRNFCFSAIFGGAKFFYTSSQKKVGCSQKKVGFTFFGGVQPSVSWFWRIYIIFKFHKYVSHMAGICHI